MIYRVNIADELDYPDPAQRLETMSGLPPYQFLPPGHPAWHQAMMAQQQAQLAAQFHAQALAQAQAMAQVTS